MMGCHLGVARWAGHRKRSPGADFEAGECPGRGCQGLGDRDGLVAQEGVEQGLFGLWECGWWVNEDSAEGTVVT